MCDSNSSRSKRSLAGIVGALILVALLFSAFYIAAEADHDCTGADCPICACIQQCENSLHSFCEGLAGQAAIVIPVIFLFLSALLFLGDFTQETPVSRKVRLNN